MTSQGVDWTVDKAGRILPDSNQRVKSHAVQEKISAKLVNSKVNFTRKTDIVLIAS